MDHDYVQELTDTKGSTIKALAFIFGSIVFTFLLIGLGVKYEMSKYRDIRLSKTLKVGECVANNAYPMDKDEVPDFEVFTIIEIREVGNTKYYRIGNGLMDKVISKNTLKINYDYKVDCKTGYLY